MNAATLMWQMGFALCWVGLAVTIERSPELVHWTQAAGLAHGLSTVVFVHGSKVEVFRG